LPASAGTLLAKPDAPHSGRSLYLGIGILALVAIAVIAGAVLSHRTTGEAPANSAIGALFQKKPTPPPIKTETSPADDHIAVAPAAPAINQQVAPPPPKQDAKPAPVHLVPQQNTPAAAPAPQKAVVAPQIAPQKIVPAPQKPVAVPQKPGSCRKSPRLHLSLRSPPPAWRRWIA
jgi:hypothetical protein